MNKKRIYDIYTKDINDTINDFFVLKVIVQFIQKFTI